MNNQTFKKSISCVVLSLLACVLALFVFNLNTLMAFAATETVEENDYMEYTIATRNEYKDKLFYADSFTNNGYTLNYRYYTPSDMSESVPLIIALHGRGERGSDNDSQLNNAFVRPFIEDENSKFYGAMVIAPQCPEKDYNNGWVNLFDNTEDSNNLNYNNYSVDEIEESDECLAIVALIEETCQKYNIDRDRIYLIGISQGAVAVYDLLARHSELFAAAVPIAGVGDLSKVDIYAEIPIYAFHGNADTTVSYERAKELYDAIEAQGKGLFNLIVYEGGPHAIWESAIVFPGTDTMPSLEDWLFAQSRDGATSNFEWWIIVLVVAIIIVVAFIIGLIIYRRKKKSARNS